MHHVIPLAIVLVSLSVTIGRSISDDNRSSETIDSPLRIEIGDRNPWTNLEFRNDPNEFQFAILSDRTGKRRPGVFARAVEQVNRMSPEFVMSVGDLIEGYSTDPGVWALEWSEFERIIDRLDVPFFYCAGNHDISNPAMSVEWKRKFGRSYYSFRYRDVLFLVLDTEDLPDKDKAYSIGTAQQRWAIEQLNTHRDARWTLVFLHKPTWTYKQKDDDPARLGWLSIEDALQGRSYTVFAGHKHRYAKFERHGMKYYMLATTGGGTSLDEGIENGRFDHFVWVTMTDDGPQLANVLLDSVLPDDVSVLPDE